MHAGYYEFTFLRHGESHANLAGYFQGQSNTSLTERGKAQVESLIKRWIAEQVNFDLIISSPLSRALQTAEMISQALNTPLEINDIWLERDTGELTGVDRNEATKLDYFKDFYTPFDLMGKTGEGDWALFLRAGKGIADLLKRPPGKYLVVSHGGIMNQALRAISGVTPQPNSMGVQYGFVNTSFAKVHYYPDTYRWHILTINDHTHIMK